jgi:hypothetical protein
MRTTTVSIAASLVASSIALLTPLAAHACPCPADASSCSASCDDDIEPAKERLGVRVDAWRAGTSLDRLGSSGASVFGIGTSMHARFGAHVAMEMGFDLGYGQGAGGLQHYELSFRMPDVLVYLNPQSSTQIYMRTGVTQSILAFEAGDGATSLPSQTAFYYLGGVAGLGVQHFVSKDTAFSVELRGTARARIDGSGSDYATTNPDFHAATRIDKGVSVMIAWLAF